MGKDMNKISVEELEKGIKFITPKFTAKWPWLTKPDTKFNEGGVFRVTAVLDPNIPEDLEFLELIDKVGEAAYEQAKLEIVKEKNADKRNRKLKQLVLAPVSQEELIEHVWDATADCFSGAIRVHMSSLRKKLKARLGYDPILNKVGEGYKIREESDR